jgi:hypothetical protein
MPAGHGDGAVLHKKKGSVLFIRATIPQTRITKHHAIYYNCMIHRHACATRSKYTLLRYSSNFEENEHKQVTGYGEASTSLLSPYLFYFRHFFRLRIAWSFNSILSVLFLICPECNSFL